MSTYVSGSGRAATTRAKSALGGLDFLGAEIAGGERKQQLRIRGRERLRLFELLRGLARLVHRHQRLRKRQPQLHVARRRDVIHVRIVGQPPRLAHLELDDRQRLQRVAVIDRRRGRSLERVPRASQLAGAATCSAPRIIHPCSSAARKWLSASLSLFVRRLLSASATYGRAQPEDPGSARRRPTGPTAATMHADRATRL